MRAVEKRLRERIKYLEGEVETLTQDRAQFRDHFKKRFRWWVELLGKNQTPSLPWVIENDAKFLHTVQNFYWG